jgi:hypothetical protein
MRKAVTMAKARKVDPKLPGDAALRAVELAAAERPEAQDDRANRGFVQVYEQGWIRLQGLIVKNPTAARLWAFLAQHIDGAAGAVVVGQELLAEQLGVSERTIRRMSVALEQAGAMTRIRIAGTVYAYALNPEEVWKSWDKAKDLAAFHTKTLAKKSDRQNGSVDRKLRMMMTGKVAQPDLLDDLNKAVTAKAA